MKNPYPEDEPNRIDDTTIGGERLATKWYIHNGLTVVVVQKERAYLCYGFEERQRRVA